LRLLHRNRPIAGDQQPRDGDASNSPRLHGGRFSDALRGPRRMAAAAMGLLRAFFAERRTVPPCVPPLPS
jgi:hypothetical protein